MANDYFNHVLNVIPAGVRALAAQVNNIANEVSAGLDKLPTEVQLKRGLTRFAVDTGAADAYVVTLPYTPALVDGLEVSFRPINNNTGASTVDVNALGAKPIVLYDLSALEANAIVANSMVTLRFSQPGDHFILLTGAAAVQGIGQAATVDLVDEAADTTNFLVFANNATGAQALKTNTNLQFNALTGKLAGAQLTDPVVDNLYVDSTLANDGNPLLRLIFDTGNSDHDWYLARGVQYVGGQWQLAAAGVSPTGIFFNGDATTNGVTLLAARNHNSDPAGTNIGRPEDWSPGCSIRLTSSTGFIDFDTNSVTRARIGDADFQIDDLRVTGTSRMVGGSLSIEGSSPIQRMTENDVGTDAKTWSTIVDAIAYNMRVEDDALANSYNYMTVTRSGTGAGVQVDTIDFTAATDITLNAPLVQLNDQLDIAQANARTAIDVNHTGTNGIALNVIANNASRTNDVAFIQQANTSSLAIALQVQQDGNSTGVLIDKNGTGAGSPLAITNEGTGAGISVIQTGVASAVSVTQNAAAIGVSVTAADAGSRAGRFSSNVASRTQPVLEVVNDNTTGSTEAVKITQDHAGPHLVLDGDSVTDTPILTGGILYNGYNVVDARIIKTSADSATNDTTLSDDSELTFEAAANASYELDLFLKINCSSATPDFKWSFNVPAGAEWMAGGHYRDQDNGGLSGQITPGSSGHLAANVIQISAEVEAMWVRLQCIVQTAGTAGTVAFQFAQNTSDAIAVSLNIGSWMKISRIDPV